MNITKASKSYYNFMNFMILKLYIIVSLFLTISKCEVITVGGEENRWTDGFSYVSWAENFNFTVGDVLVFKYSKTAHDVYDVNEETFRSCDTSSGVNSMYESGDDQVELNEAKQYWFICTIDQHCQLGMKLTINVSQPTTSTNFAAYPPTTNNTPLNHNFILIRGFHYFLFIIGIFSLLFNIIV